MELVEKQMKETEAEAGLAGGAGHPWGSGSERLVAAGGCWRLVEPLPGHGEPTFHTVRVQCVCSGRLAASVN